jgi:hypothetical protein
LGCADDGATIIDGTGVAQPTTNESDSGEPGSGTGAEGPYVGTLEVATPDGEQDYTARVPAMAALTDDAFRRGIERGAVAFGHDGAVFVRGLFAWDLEGGAEPELVAELPATLAPSQEGFFWIPEERRFLVSVIDADLTTRLYERVEGGFISRAQLGGRLQSFQRTQ